MAAAPVDIANLALSYLGAATITNLTDPTNAARVMNAEFSATRDAELRGPGVWNFAIARAALPALTSVPVTLPFTQQFQLPSDCLRVLMVGQSWPGSDLSDYRTGPYDADYLIEGGLVLCNQAAPLPLRYVSRITDTTRFDPLFDIALAAKLAWKCCERITQSKEKRQLAMQEYSQAINLAVRTNALEQPSVANADDTWILARMQ